MLSNQYLKDIYNSLPRILALFDTNPVSSTYGIGDRYYWAWKLIDFGNGTFQGAANGLARLTAASMLPDYLSERTALKRIDGMFTGADALRRRNGSMEEAFPYESSFCVTALVAYDLLTTVELLDKRIDNKTKDRYLDIVRLMIRFLHHADETHAFISNHLATAAAALYKWTKLTGEEGENRGSEILARILNEQSEEGWFREYEGADPGYQSLCTYYLADLHRMRPDLRILEPLRKSMQFLWYFAHPDGSFGGYYGSRNTRFYYPGGVEALAGEISEARALAAFMRRSIANKTTVTLETMDEPNLIPMFNAYCWAAALANERTDEPDILEIPCRSSLTWRKDLKQAGLLIDKGENHYTIISYHKGGVCYHYVNAISREINAGNIIESQKGRRYSTQAYQPDNQVNVDENSITVETSFTALHDQLPTPFTFFLLRLMNLTLMRSLWVGSLLKKYLVRLLITGKKTINARNRRHITIGKDLEIKDILLNADGFQQMNVKEPFGAIQMASQGYWQRQDEE